MSNVSGLSRAWGHRRSEEVGVLNGVVIRDEPRPYDDRPTERTLCRVPDVRARAREIRLSRARSGAAVNVRDVMSMLERGNGGTPLVLLHGLGTGARGWAPQLDSLARDRLVLAPYFPGYGQSSGQFNLDSTVDELTGLLAERGSPRVDLCGLSLGAIVALEVAMRTPERVRRVTLCGGYLYLPQEIKEQQNILVSTLRAMPHAAAQEVIDGLVADVPANHRQIARDDLAGLAPADFAEIIEQISDYNATKRASSLMVAATVCCGALDEANLSLSAILASALGTELIQLPAAGHVANLDAPDEFTRLLRS